MTATALSEAFERVGIVAPAARLRQIAVDALAKGTGTIARDCVRDQLRHDMTWALIEGWQPGALTQAVGWLLHRVEQEIKAQRPTRDAAKAADSRGPICRETQSKAAPAVPPSSNAAANAAGSRGQIGRETQSPIAPAAVIPTPQPDRDQNRLAAKSAVITRLSYLDTFVINGRRLGDVTAAEGRAWAKSSQRNGRAVEILCANMPSDRPIREYANGDMADEAFKRAEAEHAA